MFLFCNAADSSYSISTQIYGSKRWYLFPPSCTPFLRPLIAEAERQDTAVNCDEWSEAVKAEFRARGLTVVEQHEGETIFMSVPLFRIVNRALAALTHCRRSPSGWHHSVHNLSHPTFSLNHNWLNSHILATVYQALADEAARCRDAIDDVREMLVEQAQREGGGEAWWRREWEQAVDELIERSEGWRCAEKDAPCLVSTRAVALTHTSLARSWPTFWRMTLSTLRNLNVPFSVLQDRAASSRWPPIPSEARPPVAFVVAQVRSSAALASLDA